MRRTPPPFTAILISSLFVWPIIAWPIIATASECVDYRDFMHWESNVALPAPALDFLIDDSVSDRAYVATMTGVGAVSLADPAAPALLDTLELWLMDRVRTPMALAGDRLWVAAGERGLCLIQTQPLAVTAWIQTPGEPRDVKLSDGLAVIADWDEGLQIYDAEIFPPTRLGGVDLPGFASAVAVVGDRAYVADLLGLSVVDIADPAAPIRMGSIALSGESFDVAVRDGIAYVVGNFGVHTVDISDPQHPEEIDYLQRYASRIIIEDDHAILCDAERLAFLDLANPRKPTVLSEIGHGNDAIGLAILNDRLYLAGNYLRVLNHAHFALPPVLGQIQDRYYRFDSMAIDGHLVITEGFQNLMILDVTDPSHPVVASASEERGVTLVTAGGGFAYLVLDRECEILDLSTPESPITVARVASPENMADCAVDGTRLYLLSHSQGLEIVDVTQPSAPIVRSTYDHPGGNRALCARGDLVYLAGYDLKGRPRLLILDVGDPAAPHAIGGYEFSGDGSLVSLAVEGNRAYVVSDGFYGSPAQLATLDVSDPSQPTLLGQIDLYSLPTPGYLLEALGNHLYIWGSGGFTILDMADPNSPAVVATRLDTNLSALAITPDWIAATNGLSFLVLPLQCQTPSPVELTSFEAEPIPGAIRLAWRTGREWDHLGFHVERSTAETGAFEQLTTTLIPSPGPYTFLDRRTAPGATYYYRLAAVARSGARDVYGPWSATALPGTNPAPPPKPSTYQLTQSQPNPFLLGDRTTAIAYSLATSGRARIRLFDATGRLVATLVDADLPAGEHLATWDGRTVRGETAPAGTYFYRLEAGSYSATQQLVRLR